MPHHTSLIATIVIGLGLAFICGVLANRLRLSPLVGYLVAGVLVGPFTPGFVADQALAPQLAEIGVILLMFGVGLHFSLKDLLALRSIAVPGAIGQIAVVTLLGFGLAQIFGWGWGQASSSDLPSRWRALWLFCMSCRRGGFSRPSAGALRWAGSSLRTWSWSWRSFSSQHLLG